MPTTNHLAGAGPINGLPYIDYPFYNESLIGYLLRLDFLNCFSPADIIKICVPENYHWVLETDDYELIENSICSKTISILTNISPIVFDKMKLSNIRKSIFKYNCAHTKRLLKYGELKICPECIKNWRISQIFLFDNIESCLLHGLKLISKCDCGHKINIFNNISIPVCNRKSCLKEYSNLCIQADLAPKAFDINQHLQNTFAHYLCNRVPLVQENEKLLKGLQERIKYFRNIEISAYRTIFRTDKSFRAKIRFNIPSVKIGYTCDLFKIISIQYEFGVSSFHFYSLDESEFNSPIETKIVSTYEQTVDGSSEELVLETLACRSYNRNFWFDDLVSLSLFIRSDMIFFYEVDLKTERLIYHIKCCLFRNTYINR